VKVSVFSERTAGRLDEVNVSDTIKSQYSNLEVQYLKNCIKWYIGGKFGRNFGGE
jgi:hypothetical protein